MKKGFIVRTQAEQATDDELAADCKYLKKLGIMQQRLRSQPSPQRFGITDLDSAQRVLRDMVEP